MSSDLLIPRKAWGARYRAGVGGRTLPTAELWLHHTVTLAPDLAFRDLNADSVDDDEVKAMRTIEDIGQQRFGYGFSYNVAVMPSGRLYEGCGVARVGSHTGGRNTRAMGIVLVGDYSKSAVPDTMRDAVVLFMREGERRRWLDQARIDGGHRDLKSTGCPGDYAYALIPTFNALAANTAPVQEDDMAEYLDKTSSKAAIELMQKCLKAEGAASGRVDANGVRTADLVVDGDWGPATDRALDSYATGRVHGRTPGRLGGVLAALLFRWEP